MYLGLSLVPSIESRLITTKALAFLNSEVPRSIPVGLAFYGSMHLYVGGCDRAGARDYAAFLGFFFLEPS